MSISLEEFKKGEELNIELIYENDDVKLRLSSGEEYNITPVHIDVECAAKEILRRKKNVALKLPEIQDEFNKNYRHIRPSKIDYTSLENAVNLLVHKREIEMRKVLTHTSDEHLENYFYAFKAS